MPRIRALTHDVVVIGAGYTGSLAAMTLARQGLRVALVDAASLPHFAIGESTTPEQLLCHAYLGTQWKIPELVRLSSFDRVRLSPLTIPIWPKRSFYFLSQPTEAADRKPRELLHQAVPPSFHCVRGDFDLHLCEVARRWGADLHIASQVTDIDLTGPVRCAIELDRGEREIVADLLVDASGPAGLLARKLDLLEQSPPWRSLRSRSIYNHFLGVRPLEGAFTRDWPRLPFPRDLSTMHHLWPDAWAWVIPFDNQVTSVGVALDLERVEAAVSGERLADRFWAQVRSNPAFFEMMKDAQPIRPWRETGEIQWAASKTVGHNWVILPPASGPVDPLLSPGMSMAAVAVARLAYHAHDGFIGRRPAEEALATMAARQRRELEYVCRYQHVLYRCFPDHELFGASYTVYRMATLLRSLAPPDESSPLLLHELWALAYPEIRELIDELDALLSGVEVDSTNAPDVRAQVSEALRRTDRRFGFTASGCNDPASPGIHLTRLVPQLRWNARLTRQSTRGRDPSRRALNPWMRLVVEQTAAWGRLRVTDLLPGGWPRERGWWRDTLALGAIVFGIGGRGARKVGSAPPSRAGSSQARINPAPRRDVTAQRA